MLQDNYGSSSGVLSGAVFLLLVYHSSILSLVSASLSRPWRTSGRNEATNWQNHGNVGARNFFVKVCCCWVIRLLKPTTCIFKSIAWNSVAYILWLLFSGSFQQWMKILLLLPELPLLSPRQIVSLHRRAVLVIVVHSWHSHGLIWNPPL